MAGVYLSFFYQVGFPVSRSPSLSVCNPLVSAMHDVWLTRELQLLAMGCTISYGVALLFAKTAILLEWMRIFSPPGAGKTTFRRTSQTLLVLNGALYVSSLVVVILECIPVGARWNPKLMKQQGARCIDVKAFHIATGFFNVFIDAFILVLPQPIIWTVYGITTKQRVGISVMFSLGVLATACAIGRLASNFGLEYYRMDDNHGTKHGDTTYTVSAVLVWGLAEASCVLLVFCVPALPKAFDEQGVLYRTVRFVVGRLASLGGRSRISPGDPGVSNDRSCHWASASSSQVGM